ncbi:MAG TPA: glycosyltransferase family 4 protein [Phycisphaerales bacterium]|nr:glycosyltransferase family 4 protein [Phycisphaerales bacterium]HMP36755.1 glycosyltransferase family 4 protein [Phycisphaerales bacterium]
MRIGFILPANYCVSGPGNGVRVQALCQAAALRRLGHDVRTLDPWTPYQRGSLDVVQFFLGGGANHGIELMRSAGLGTLVFAPIIDSNEPNSRYRWAARLGSVVPKVFTVPSIFRSQATGSDLVICRSRHEERRLVEGLGVPKERIRIVLNGVDPPAPGDPGEAIRLHRLPPEGWLLHVGKYGDPRKNALGLIEAVGPTGLPLVIAGNAEETPYKARVIEAARRHPNVTLLGVQPPELLQALYAGCRVFCLPSVHEGTGLVALEAAVHGAAVVITRHGGPPDYFGDLAEYVDPDDVAGIRQAILRSWERPRDGKLRAHVLENLTWDRSASALLDAYASVRRAV